jgi:hypothetical protein
LPQGFCEACGFFDFGSGRRLGACRDPTPQAISWRLEAEEKRFSPIFRINWRLSLA